jgi:hypothetical protein
MILIDHLNNLGNFGQLPEAARAGIVSSGFAEREPRPNDAIGAARVHRLFRVVMRWQVVVEGYSNV